MSGIERWEDMLWDRLPHMVKYTRTTLDWVDKYVKLTFGLQKLNKDYSKGISKLVKTQKDLGVDGKSMGKSWVGVIGHLGSVAEKHRQLATVLGDIGRKYQDEAILLAEEQRTLEQNSRKFQLDLEASVLQLDKVKEKYFRRQVEAEKSEDALQRAEEDERINQEELDKIRDNADDKKNKYNKARDEYAGQLKETNRFQRDFYEETWPNMLSGMRGVAERGVECITSLLRRLDQLTREDWGDLGMIADEMEASIEEDFESFLNWVKSGNPVPQDFGFEESFKPGTMSFSTMGTLRKSISRASIRLSGSPVKARGGFGSRMSLRSPAYTKRPSGGPRSASVREGQLNYFPRMSALSDSIQETPETPEPVRLQNGGKPEVGNRAHVSESDAEEEVSKESFSSHSRRSDQEPLVRKEVQGSLDQKEPKNGMPEQRSQVKEIKPHLNGNSKHLRKQESYDDRMNPFTTDF